MRQRQSSARWLGALLLMFSFLVVSTEETRAEHKAEKTFTAVVTDTQGVDTEIRSLISIGKKKSARPLLSLTNCGISRSSEGVQPIISRSTGSNISKPSQPAVKGVRYWLLSQTARPVNLC